MTCAIRPTIAVVDDDYRLLESLESLLESAGYHVQLFRSAEALLGAGTLAEVDCLISDIGMPGLDGFGLMRLVQVARPRLPIFLITALEELARGRTPDDFPPNHLFVKPFDARKLLGALAAALENISAQTQSDA